MQKVVSELQYFSIFIFQNEKQGAANQKQSSMMEAENQNTQR